MTPEPRSVVPLRAPPPSTGSTRALIGVLLAGLIGMVIFLFVQLSSDGKIRPGASTAHAGCVKGQPDCLPELDYVDTDGVAYPHASLAGKVVLVNFWATWCNPCRKEIPDLSRMYDKYKAKGVVFLGVLTDTPDNQSLLNFKSDFEMTYPIVRASSEMLVSHGYAGSVPTTLVYDRRGKQIFHRVGMVHERELDSLLGQLVAQR